MTAPSSFDLETAALHCGIEIEPAVPAPEPASKAKAKPEPATKPDAPSSSRFIEIGEFLKRPPLTRWIIRNYVCADICIVFFGDPSSGKSLVIIDIACHIATGRDWCGNPVKEGLVLYVCGEGQHGLSKRFMAWFQRYGEVPRNIHIATIPAALTDDAHIAGLIEDIATNLPAKPVAIFLDTLNRNFGPGDENSTADMTKVVNNLDRIRREFENAIGVAHHTSKGDKTNGRGSSVLKGAAELEFLIDKNPDTKIVTMRYAKPPKDFNEPPALAWVITKQGTPWADEDGQPIDSVILEPISVPQQTAKKHGLGKNQQSALDALKQLHEEHAENLRNAGIDPEKAKVRLSDWYNVLKRNGFHKNRCTDAKNDLLMQNLIRMEGSYVYPV